MSLNLQRKTQVPCPPSTSIRHALQVKTRNDYGLRIWIFSQKLLFSVGKKNSKTNLRSTIHNTYTSYNKYFRLCMVSEELQLNEIGPLVVCLKHDKTWYCKKWRHPIIGRLCNIQAVTVWWHVIIGRLRHAIIDSRVCCFIVRSMFLHWHGDMIMAIQGLTKRFFISLQHL